MPNPPAQPSSILSARHLPSYRAELAAKRKLERDAQLQAQAQIPDRVLELSQYPVNQPALPAAFERGGTLLAEVLSDPEIIEPQVAQLVAQARDPYSQVLECQRMIEQEHGTASALGPTHPPGGAPPAQTPTPTPLIPGKILGNALCHALREILWGSEAGREI